MINRTRLTDTFLALTAIDAESYHERAIADELIRRLEALGLTVTEDDQGEALSKLGGVDPAVGAGNLFAVLPATAPGEPILLSAHMDTVSPGNRIQAVLHEDGRITSDGSTVLGADDHAAVAEILEILAVIQEKQIPHPKIEVLISAAEEPYCQGSRVFDYSVCEAKEAYVFDMSGPVGYAAVAAPSLISFKVEVKGRSAHAGFAPEAGIHAIAIAGEALSHIQNGHADEETTVNIGTIQGGVQANVVPNSVVLTGEIRSMQDEKALAQLEHIRSAFEKAAEKFGGSATVTSKQQVKAYRIDETEPVATRFVKAANSVGLEPIFRQTFGGSDNNHFATHDIRGIVVACAMNRVHSVDEYTTVDELVKATELMLALVTAD